MGKKKVKPSGLVQRNSTYYFRLDLPTDVRPIFGKTAIWESFETSDYDAAIAAWGPKHSEWKEKIAAARSGTLRHVDEDSVIRIAATLLHTNQTFFGSIEEIGTCVHEALPRLCKVAGIIRWSDADEVAIRDCLIDHYIAALQAWGGDKDRLRSQASFHNAADWFAEQRDQPKTDLAFRGVMDAYELWKATANARDKTEIEFKSACQEFIGVNGDWPLSEVTEAHFVTYKKHLNTLRSERTGELLSQATRNKRMGGVKAVFRAAIENGDLKVHPGTNVVVAKGARSKLRVNGLFDDELELLFTSPVFTECYRPPEVGEASFWVPVLALYTGARQSELCQLMVADVVKSDGVFCLRITNQGDGQHVKTESSHRLVPIADRLIELGILKYVATLDAKGKLFPAIRPDTHGVHGGLFSKWFGRYRKQIGLNRKGGDFHALRHLAKTKLRAASGDGEAKLEITGHSSGTVSSGYGRIAVREMKKIIDQLAYDVAIPKWTAAY